ncbi:hypothetical protein QTO34_010088 [Cnephaeus nilssonii]|uniref:Uncharacterized protein n=1 Tax=Cnephaeus nilssonii TaxID=3371016 RepID=A0AA40HEQ4_CNENI|nr:hypothetical protein QTO34_010088 [Eptesicus nilssonii]
MESMESILWTSQEDLKNSLYSLQFSKNTPDSNIYSMPPRSSTEASSARFLEGAKRRYSQLPIGTKLLHEAKKISRQLSLVMSLLGILIISLITLGQPWVHFQVPLTPPGGPADPPPRTMPINTIFFVRCPDISCLHEQDHNAYLLDSAWAFFLISSFTSFCLCLILIDITFFSSSNVPLLDFSNIILSNLTGMARGSFPEGHQDKANPCPVPTMTANPLPPNSNRTPPPILTFRTSMILGVLFYLLQAREFLQEGMTYSLGRSFYLAWIGIFFFLAIGLSWDGVGFGPGLISYMNYVNFWFILAPQGIWT